MTHSIIPQVISRITYAYLPTAYAVYRFSAVLHTLTFGQLTLSTGYQPYYGNLARVSPSLQVISRSADTGYLLQEWKSSIDKLWETKVSRLRASPMTRRRPLRRRCGRKRELRHRVPLPRWPPRRCGSRKRRRRTRRLKFPGVHLKKSKTLWRRPCFSRERGS